MTPPSWPQCTALFMVWLAIGVAMFNNTSSNCNIAFYMLCYTCYSNCVDYLHTPSKIFAIISKVRTTFSQNNASGLNTMKPKHKQQSTGFQAQEHSTRQPKRAKQTSRRETLHKTGQADAGSCKQPRLSRQCCQLLHWPPQDLSGHRRRSSNQIEGGSGRG